MTVRGRRLVAGWRTLVEPPPPSPAMETFLGWLAQTPYRWSLTADGKIRASAGDTQLCAVTAVALHRRDVTFSLGAYLLAAPTVGLSRGDAALVVNAADDDRPRTRTRRLRVRLLIATGLRPPAAPPSPTPEPLDRELAALVAGHAFTACRSDRRRPGRGGHAPRPIRRA